MRRPQPSRAFLCSLGWIWSIVLAHVTSALVIGTDSTAHGRYNLLSLSPPHHGRMDPSSASTTAADAPSVSSHMTAQCACGRVRLDIAVDALSLAMSASDCHCPHCRKYHTAAFVSYLALTENNNNNENNNNHHHPTTPIVQWTGPVATFAHTCDEMGPVERVRCRVCSSKLATRVVNGNSMAATPLFWLVNMGPLADETIPDHWADQWRFHRNQWQTQSQVSWTNLAPGARYSWRQQQQQQPTAPIVATCACRAVSYEWWADLPSEVQHCYCRLCRQYSGAAFMTWMPASNRQLHWTAPGKHTDNKNHHHHHHTNKDNHNFNPAIPRAQLRRTTPHGQRHFCPQCGSALTIVYDQQPGVTWPAAGAFDDDNGLPRTDTARALYRAIHICCRYQPKWYNIPSDGLDRLAEAG